MNFIRLPSPNFDPRPRGVDMLVLHYTGMPTARDALERLCDPLAKVSAHYLIDEDGTTFALVPEDRRAWHAGVSFWAGATDINDRSVGIELVNPGHDWGYRPFPEAQMAALERLARDVMGRHGIAPARVLGHSDIAPRRKQDPGELFDWPRLARAGIGLWPEAAANDAPLDEATARERLSAFGYEVEDLAAAVAAFQRHFRPTRIDGTLDAECAARLEALIALARPLIS